MSADPQIPDPSALSSQRAVYQALAERLGVLAPGETLSDELMAFAEEVARMAGTGSKVEALPKERHPGEGG